MIKLCFAVFKKTPSENCCTNIIDLFLSQTILEARSWRKHTSTKIDWKRQYGRRRGHLDTMMTDLIDDLDELKVRGLDVLDLRLDINQVFRVFIEQQIIKLV